MIYSGTCKTENVEIISPIRTTNRAEIIIAKIYIYMLPVRMISPLVFSQKLLAACARSFDLVFHLLGFFLFFILARSTNTYADKNQKQLMRFLIYMVLWFNISSFIMAFFIQARFGNIGNEDAYSSVFYQAIYFFQYMFMLIYNRRIFSIVTKDDILKILNRVSNALLVIGYLQICVMTFGSIFVKIYNTINVCDVLIPANKLSKLSLSGSEGAYAGSLIAIFAFPLIFARLLNAEKTYKNIVKIFIWLPVLYYTYSSAAYILFAMELITFSVILLTTRKNSGLKILLLITAVIVLVFSLFPETIISIMPQNVSNKIRYLLFEKATDLSNGSTVSRMMPVYMNAGAFSEYPVIGVGNGCQGYFYEKYFPQWAYNVKGSDFLFFLQKAQNGIANGAVFVLSILSGYGIVGSILFISFIVKCVRYAKKNKERMKQFYYMYLIGMAALLFDGLRTGFEGKYYIWFIISLPFIVNSEKSDVQKKGKQYVGL